MKRTLKKVLAVFFSLLTAVSCFAVNGAAVLKTFTVTYNSNFGESPETYAEEFAGKAEINTLLHLRTFNRVR